MEILRLRPLVFLMVIAGAKNSFRSATEFPTPDTAAKAKAMIGKTMHPQSKDIPLSKDEIAEKFRVISPRIQEMTPEERKPIVIAVCTAIASESPTLDDGYAGSITVGEHRVHFKIDYVRAASQHIPILSIILDGDNWTVGDAWLTRTAVEFDKLMKDI